MQGTGAPAGDMAGSDDTDIRGRAGAASPTASEDTVAVGAGATQDAGEDIGMDTGSGMQSETGTEDTIGTDIIATVGAGEAVSTAGADGALGGGSSTGAGGSGGAALPKSDHEKQAAAREFAERWAGAGEKEIADTQGFWRDLLGGVFGCDSDTLKSIMQFEKPVYVDGHKRSIDAFITLKSVMGTSRILIEQKKRGTDMAKEGKQSGGAMLSPYQQAKRYADNLPLDEKPRWIVTCNFATFAVYDMNLKRPEQKPEEVRLADLGSEWYRLAFLADPQKEVEKRQEAASRQTGQLIGDLYDLLLSKCLDPHNPATLKSLNIFCVRLVFCFYAEDTGLFGDEKTLFDEYVRSFSPEHLRDGLKKLFTALDTPEGKRDPYDRQIAAFPYADGGLFSGCDIEIPYIDGEVRSMILECGEADWSEIDPVIFGSIFESTLNPETRRTGGMHYTAPANIDKVLDPLFMDELAGELSAIKASPSKGKRTRLEAFQDKLAGLRFLDPACGSGNFLTRAYARLRTLENEAIEAMMSCPVDDERMQTVFADESFSPVKVSLSQFWGIEINDFAVSVAKTALWIAERQMLQATERILGRQMEFLPISTQTHIAEGSALTLDWGTMEGAREGLTVEDTLFADVGEGERLSFDYIMGNPPFVGYFLQSDAQKADLLSVCTDDEGRTLKTAGKIDYVAGWYYKAASFIQGTTTRCAFVSTNSITQGEQVAAVWQELFRRGVHIDFAWHSFKWQQDQSEDEAGEGDEPQVEHSAAGKVKRKAKRKEEREEEREFRKEHKVAAVYCVVVGFSTAENSKSKVIYEERQVKTDDGKKQSHVVTMTARNINGYLLDAPCVFVESRKSPLCEGVPEMILGSIPRDGGAFYLTPDERKAAIKKEPGVKQFIKRVVGSDEFINGKERWCLWLVDSTAHDRNTSTLIKKRMSLVREFREKSKRETTKELAKVPFLFAEIRQPSTDYLIVPCTSSEKRKYVPMGFLPPDVICSNAAQFIAGATLYHFGVLTSSVHMAWMRAVCGRLKSDYRYSSIVVYNTFVWPTATDQQRQRIEDTAKTILAARANEKGSTLADMYNDLNMPPDLRTVHEANDRAVLAAYGWDEDTAESDIVAHLMEKYQKKVGE